MSSSVPMFVMQGGPQVGLLILCLMHVVIFPKSLAFNLTESVEHWLTLIIVCR